MPTSQMSLSIPNDAKHPQDEKTREKTDPFDEIVREAYNCSRSQSDLYWTRLPTRGLCNGGFANLVRVETQQP